MQYINDTICVGAKEIWTIRNESNVSHPFHIHKIFFRVLDVQDAEGNYLDLDSLGFNGALRMMCLYVQGGPYVF